MGRDPPFHTIAAAEGKDVTIGGGASTAQQYLRGADFVDELTVHVVPVLLGGGERLFDHLDGSPVGLEPRELEASPVVAHFRYSRTG